MPRAWACLILALAACGRYEAAGFDTVGPGYAVGGGGWNTGGGITAVARVLEREGRAVVCGAWTTDRQSVLSVPLNRDVMQAASVYAGGTRLVQNLEFMTHVPEAESLAGDEARCVTSSKPWRPAFAETEPRLRFPRMAFPEGGGDDEMGGSGDTTVFRETARPDLTR